MRLLWFVVSGQRSTSQFLRLLRALKSYHSLSLSLSLSNIIIIVPHKVMTDVAVVSHPCPWLMVFGHVTHRALRGKSMGQDGSQQEFDWLVKQTLVENWRRLMLTMCKPDEGQTCPLTAFVLKDLHKLSCLHILVILCSFHSSVLCRGCICLGPGAF